MTIRNAQTAIVAVLAAAALLVAGAGTVLVVLPQQTKAGHLSSELAAAEARLVAAQMPAASAKQIGAADLFRLREAMPSSDEMPEILIELSRVAQASSVSIVSVKPSPLVSLPQGYEALPLAVVIEGRYAGVTAFLRRLRQSVQTAHGRLSVSGRLFVANQIQLATTKSPQVEATLTMDAIEYGASVPTTASASTSTGSTSTSTTSG